MNKLLLVTAALFSLQGLYAQTNLREQITTPEYKDDVPDSFANDRKFYSNRAVKLSPKHCEELAKKRADIAHLIGTPQYMEELNKLKPLDKLCYIRVFTGDAGVTGFTLVNDSKNKINPDTAPNGSTRSFNFNFEERSRQDLNLKITENSGLTGRMSHDLLETTIVFVPRRVVPYIDMGKEVNECHRKVVLPTNEYILFDALTKEIVGGVLEEAPMDMTASRHQRKFAGLEYTGNGIMIRADRRAGTPEHTYSVSYNVNEKISKATLTRKGKTCLVEKDLIWEGTHNPDSSAYFKYGTDQEFLDRVVNPICGWNLTLEDIM